MKFALVEQVDDTVKVSERKLVDAIYAAIRPLGYKVSAMMDETEVTAFIAGTALIIERSSEPLAPLRISKHCPSAPLRIRNQQEKAADRRQHILVTIGVILAAIALTTLYRWLKYG